MDVTFAPPPPVQYHRDIAGTTNHPVVAAVAASQPAKPTDPNNIVSRAQIDKSNLLTVGAPEKPEPTIGQTLKPYGVIMLPFREDDPATTRTA